jgi:hypothetical protein
MLVYHKLSAEITGDDGREWIVSVEPPLKAPPEGEATSYEITIQRVHNGTETEPAADLKYNVPSQDGMFSALNMGLALVPNMRGND